MSTRHRPAATVAVAALAAAGAIAAGTVTALSPASAAPAGPTGPTGAGPSYHVYVADVYGADLGACRQSARKGQAWRIRGVVDASAATRNDIIGGLVVLKDGDETSNTWLSGKTASGQARTGSVVVPTSGFTVSGFVGIDGAGDSFTKAPGAIKAC